MCGVRLDVEGVMFEYLPLRVVIVDTEKGLVSIVCEAASPDNSEEVCGVTWRLARGAFNLNGRTCDAAVEHAFHHRRQGEG